MPKYIISAEAIADLREIWLYTFEEWSIEQADRYYNQLLDEIEYLSDNYYIGKDYGEKRKGYRYLRVNSHLIFYRQIKEEIEIVRILHGKMDVDSKLTAK